MTLRGWMSRGSICGNESAVGLVGAAMSVVGAIALLCAWRRRVRASRASLPRSPRPGPPHAPQSHVTVEGNPLAPPPKTPLVVEAVVLDEDEAPPAYGVVVSQGMTGMAGPARGGRCAEMKSCAAASSSSATTPMPPLNQACEEFKRELGVGGANVAEMLTQKTTTASDERRQPLNVIDFYPND